MDANKLHTPLHIFGRFEDPYAGAEREMPDLVHMLNGRREVHMWSDVAPHVYFARQGVRQIAPAQQDFPRGGMLLLSGVHVQLGDWLEQARPDRVVLRYNLPNHRRLFDVIAQMRSATTIDPELIFVSNALRVSVGLPGRIEPSLIRLDEYLHQPVQRADRPVLTVGRVSRDVIEKHDPQDVALYRMLAARGVHVRVLGGTCLAPALAGVSGIELLPVGFEPVADFLRSLDIFFYRTGSVIEAYGRVVLEAMASGLPVVVASNGGYAEQISHGVDGFLVHDQEGAIQAITLLLASAERRRQTGNAARARAVTVHGDDAIERMLGNYL